MVGQIDHEVSTPLPSSALGLPIWCLGLSDWGENLAQVDPPEGFGTGEIVSGTREMSVAVGALKLVNNLYQHVQHVCQYL